MDNKTFSFLLPQTASHVAAWWNDLFNFVMGISLVFFVPLILVTAYFVFRYHHTRVKKVEDFHGNTSLEILWTVIPTILVLFIFVWGWLVYKKMTRSPKDAFEVRVMGQQWQWKFSYNNGKKTIGELVLPAGKRVRLLMTSEDVIHSFFVPDYRVKSDVVPGLYTSVWFETMEPGEHIVYCSEYCGGLHSNMLATVKILPEDEWQEWWNQSDDNDVDMSKPPAERGKALMAKYACNTCHSTDGTVVIGPSFRNLWGQTEKLSDGTTALVDEDYVRNKILNPNKNSVAGFPKVMPSFQGLISEEQILDIIAYLKTIKD